jgi:D-alanyl-D-alanine carboxypeptidase (penicillin-binding protein 5/6)
MGFESFYQSEVCKNGELSFQIPVENGEEIFLTASNTKDISVCLPKGAKTELEFILPESLSAPIKKGEIIGKVVCRNEENKVYIINIESQTDIKEKKRSFFEKLFGEKK